MISLFGAAMGGILREAEVAGIDLFRRSFRRHVDERSLNAKQRVFAGVWTCSRRGFPLPGWRCLFSIELTPYAWTSGLSDTLPLRGGWGGGWRARSGSDGSLAHRPPSELRYGPSVLAALASPARGEVSPLRYRQNPLAVSGTCHSGIAFTTFSRRGG